MNTIFLKILDMSFMASWLMIAVILLRFALKKAPKWIVCMLWILVGVRLICPFTVESTWSLVPDSGSVVEIVISGMMTPDEGVSGENISGEDPAGIGAYDEFSDGSRGEIMMPGVNIPEADYSEYENMDGINASDDYLPESRPNDLRNDHIDYDNDNISARNALTDSVINTLGIVWVTGVALMLLYGFISYYRLHRMTAVSMEISAENTVVANTGAGKNAEKDMNANAGTGKKIGAGATIDNKVFQCDAIDTPFILGIIRPRIYLPSHMEDSWTDYVIAHEKAHIRRRDHWWKPMGFLILSVYWFNPLCWLSYILLSRDIELACDESVIRTMDADSKKIYAKALLSCSVKQKMITACPLAFGEVGIKERIRGVMNYKKPAFWIIAISLIACIVVAVCFLTNPRAGMDNGSEEEGSAEIQTTDESDFIYFYDEGLEGIVITKYIGEDTEIVIPDTIEGYPVVQIGDKAFLWHDNITGVTMPDSIISIGKEAFWNLKNLAEINLSDSLTSIDSYAFWNCKMLTDVSLPDSLTYIGTGAFEGCDNLAAVSLPSGLTYIGGAAFSGCSALTEMPIPDSVTFIGDSAFKRCSGLTSIVIPEGITSIDASTFEGCENLSSITIPDSVTKIGPSAFENCHNLANIAIPDNVTEIGYSAFKDCSSLTSVTIPDGITRIRQKTFEGCRSLTEIIIPDSVTSVGEDVFRDCVSLGSVTLSNNITAISKGMFHGCTYLHNITIPDGVTSIGLGAFSYSCIARITIPDSVTYIGGSAFYYCNSLYSITLPEGITTIEEWTFNSCRNLKEVILPESVTSIGDHAFENCVRLEDVNIPDNVVYIGKGAFSYCPNIKSLTIPDNITFIGQGAFEGSDALMVSYNGKVYDDSNDDSSDFEELYSLFNNEEDVIARFMEADWEEVRNLPYKDYYDAADWNSIVCIGDLSEYGIRIYGYNDEEISGQGIAIEMPDMGNIAGNIRYFDWNYITPRVILPDFYWDEEHEQLQGSFHIYTGTGYDADMLAVFYYDRGTLRANTYDHGDYMNMLIDRMDYRYNEDTGEMVLIDLETNEEIFVEAPEETVTALAWGDISGFELGDTVIFSVTPGYIVDGAAIPQYDNMPTLEFEININPTDYGTYFFEIGDLVNAEVRE